MQLTVLGYWGAYPYQNEGTTSYLLTSGPFQLLIDAGSSTLNVLQKQTNPLNIDAVVLSHYHHDHIADLGVLQYYRQLNQKTGIAPILPIYGHTEDLCHFEELTMNDVSRGFPYKETDTLDIGPFQLTFLRTIHPVPCFAMRIVEKTTGKILVYSADSGYFKEFTEFSKDADVLLIDTFFLEGNEQNPVHFTSKEVGQIAKQAQVKKVILTHLQQEIDHDLLQKQVISYVGDNIEIVRAKQELKVTI